MTRPEKADGGAGMPEPDIEWDDLYDEEDDLDREADCGLMDDGQCMLAGTEWCDFECPNRDSELFVGSEAWRRKHERKALATNQGGRNG